jgi:hypothetical protein
MFPWNTALMLRQGYEAVHMIRKGQIRWVAGDDLPRQIEFIDHLFDLAA